LAVNQAWRDFGTRNGGAEIVKVTTRSGDTLTGIILSLLAQKYEPEKAALLGVYLHGLAGDLAAEASSEESLIASDISAYLGMAFAKLREE
ncbi:MAG TPA: NAD(P)H-hydrate dehydratase, partial [Paludibacteraceae bacterium]|nr:NAD(P)H-hydrate dehydratase [Paludibacteraceae bacterium]